VELYIVKT